MRDFGPLLYLPRLRYLYVHGLGDAPSLDENGNDIDGCSYWGIPPAGYSSVEELYFDSPDDPRSSAIEPIMRASKQLKHVTFEKGEVQGFDFDRLTHGGWINLASLESLLACSTNALGYRSDMYEYIPCVGVMTCTLDDMVHFGDDWDDYTREDIYSWAANGLIIMLRGSGWNTEGLDEKTLEDGILKAWGLEEGDEVDEHLLDAWEFADKERVYCWSHDDERQHKEFYRSKVLYLEGLDPWNVDENDKTRRPFERIIRVGKQLGIEVYTATTKAPRVHKISMPHPATEKDLETSPWCKHPDVEKIYFKPHMGVVDDCGNCGACEACFERYPPEVWASWHEDDARLDEQVQKMREERERRVAEESDEGEDVDEADWQASSVDGSEENRES